MSAKTLAGMAGGDLTRWADIAALTALVFAGMCIVARVLRLSTLVHFISETILLGFKAGAALTIRSATVCRWMTSSKRFTITLWD
jgi:sulfate permease, SulP family